MSKITRRTLIAGAASLPLAAPVLAQGNVTTLVVPFPPGGSTDALARLMQRGLEKRLARTVIIDNKAGAAGSLGAAQVAKAAPDGNTLLITFDSHAVIPAILDKPIVDVEKDLVPVLLVGTAPYIVATSSEKPFKSFADVIAAAKAKPGAVTFASVGVGTLGHLGMTMLGKRIGIDISHVAYRGGGPAMNDVLGGHVDLVCGSAALVNGHIAGGKVRPLLQLGAKRLASLKDLQTAVEFGLEDFTVNAWWGVFAPKGTPDTVVAAVEKAVKETLSEPEVSQRLTETQEMTLVLGGPQVLDTLFKRELAFWGKVVRDNNIRLQ